MQTWAFVLGIIGTATGLIAGGAAIYSLVISHRALRLEKDKWDESKQVKLRVVLQHMLYAKLGEDESHLVNEIAIMVYNEGSVPVRIVHAWLQLGPKKSDYPIISDCFPNSESILVQPNDGAKITVPCGPVAKWCYESLGLRGDVEICADIIDSLGRKYPAHFSGRGLFTLPLVIFYRDGEYVEEPLEGAVSGQTADGTSYWDLSNGYRLFLTDDADKVIKNVF